MLPTSVRRRCFNRPPSVHTGYIGAMRRLKKLMYRVVFPFELKLRNVADECADADNVFHLFAVVVHVGSGLNHGARLAWFLCLTAANVGAISCMARVHTHSRGRGKQLRAAQTSASLSSIIWGWC